MALRIDLLRRYSLLAAAGWYQLLQVGQSLTFPHFPTNAIPWKARTLKYTDLAPRSRARFEKRLEFEARLRGELTEQGRRTGNGAKVPRRGPKHFTFIAFYDDPRC